MLEEHKKYDQKASGSCSPKPVACRWRPSGSCESVMDSRVLAVIPGQVSPLPNTIDSDAPCLPLAESLKNCQMSQSEKDDQHGRSKRRVDEAKEAFAEYYQLKRTKVTGDGNNGRRGRIEEAMS